MRYPSRLLTPGEEVTLEVRSHAWVLAGPVVVCLVALSGALAAVVSDVQPAVDALAGGVLVLALVWLVARFVRWSVSVLVVTTERVVWRRGFTVRRETDVPLGMVRDVRVRQSLWQRVLRAGDLEIDSGTAEERFGWLPAPGTVKRELWRQVDRNRRGASVADELDRLDELRRRGVLTPGEFEAEKARLLHR